MEESSVSLVTSHLPTAIQFGIWGILPQGYNKEWAQFQNFENTLTTNLACLDPNHWLYEALKLRRCFVIITGYFNYFLEGKNLKPIYAHSSSEKIVCLAGIYNQTEDGFLTFSLLTKTSNHFQTKTSFAPIVPLILSEKEREFWLGKKTSTTEILDFLDTLSPGLWDQSPAGPKICFL